MSGWAHLGRIGLIGGALMTVAACSDPGDLSVSNESPDEVTVLTGDEELTVPASGGAAILDYGCTKGDVTVRFASGASVVLSGPVCPEQEIVIRGETASLQPATPTGT